MNYLDLKTLQNKTIENVTKFIGMDLSDQRKCLSDRTKPKKKEVEQYIRGICDIIKNIVTDLRLVKYFILLLDGMIEGTL